MKALTELEMTPLPSPETATLDFSRLRSFDDEQERIRLRNILRASEVVEDFENTTKLRFTVSQRAFLVHSIACEL